MKTAVVFSGFGLVFAGMTGCSMMGQTAQPTPAQTQNDMLVAACQANVDRLVGTYCRTPPSPLPTGYAESVRRGYESQKGTCSPQILAPLEACVSQLEATATQQDPQAKERRAAAAPKAAAMKQDPKFKGMIDEWLQTFDQMKIICRNRTASDSHARECERYEKDLAAVADRLRTFLVGSGFDQRDLGELGLWPTDPNPMGD